MATGRPTLARQAYAEIQGKILSGELSAGQRLFPDELALELAISQTPIKEALALLERDGLVTGNDRRASLVRRFLARDIVEIYEARVLIEVNSVTAGWHAGRVDPPFIAALADLVAQQFQILPARSKAALGKAIALDREFHERLVRLGDNSVLAGWHQSIQMRLQTARTYSIDNYVSERVRVEHMAILEAFKAGDLSAIVPAIRHHLDSSRDDLVARHPDELPVK